MSATGSNSKVSVGMKTEEVQEAAEGQELTNKYLRGELSFTEYAQLLAAEDDDPTELDGELDLDELDSGGDAASTAGGEGPASVVPSGAGDDDENMTARESIRSQRRLLKRRTLPAVLQGMMGEANLRYARGDTEDAETICKEIIRQCPLAPEPFQTMAMMHEERGDHERGLQYSLIAAHLSKPDVDEWLRLARISEAKQSHKQAVVCYTRAIEAAPQRLELHLKRVELVKLITKTAKLPISYLKRAVTIMCDGSAGDAFRVMKELHQLLMADKLYDDAKEYWAKVFDKHGDKANWEDTHVYLELLLTTGSPGACVGALLRFCGVRFEPPVPADASDWAAALAGARSVTVPEGVPLDVKYKLLLALIQLECVRLADKSLIPSLKTCDPEEYGDIYMDVAEALMEKKHYEAALQLLNMLTQSHNYCLVRNNVTAGVWLRVAECHHELGRMEQAVAAYREVVARAPSHSQARLVLSTILHQLGRPEEAIAVLSQEVEQEVLDSDLLLEKSALLEKEGRIVEFIDTVRTLLSQHCPIIRDRDEAKSMLVGFKVREHTLRQLRKLKPDTYDDPGPAFVDRPTELERHWTLLKKALSYLEERGQFSDCVDLIMRAKGSREFNQRTDISKDLDTMCAIASFRAADYEMGFPVVRKMLLAEPEVQSLWNLLNLVTMRAEDIRHARFLMRLTHRLPELVALSLLNGHNCLMSGTYKYALVEYVSAYKLEPRDPLIALLVGVTMIHLAAQKFTTRKHSLVVQAQAFLGQYASLRGDTQESMYNMGRGMHELGLLPNAVHYYTRALELEPSGGNPALDLRRETAYNLALIYRASGNLTLARRLTHRYCII
ncbi:General transcription factor 3C polypeptide 3 [Amphibalanus amphitrite]|uniref:General transcription factor 3C polypeptide 3 n=1 Tax=Amphibalanus amphitrite TaxID=1232801 RepID=A0A6A4V7W5_AMPAM|nr:General transcription factor 3C polypeptide 3 [Amphibalanus amphitrite]